MHIMLVFFSLARLDHRLPSDLNHFLRWFVHGTQFLSSVHNLVSSRTRNMSLFYDLRSEIVHLRRIHACMCPPTDINRNQIRLCSPLFVSYSQLTEFRHVLIQKTDMFYVFVISLLPFRLVLRIRREMKETSSQPITINKKYKYLYKPI